MCSCVSAYLAWHRQLHLSVASQHYFLSLQAGATAYVCVRAFASRMIYCRTQSINCFHWRKYAQWIMSSLPPPLPLRTFFCLPLPDIICVIIIISCFSLSILSLSFSVSLSLGVFVLIYACLQRGFIVRCESSISRSSILFNTASAACTQSKQPQKAFAQK